MAENAEYKEFRSLLRSAIGPERSQADFAKEADLNPSTLSRMLNLPEIPRPSMTTLRKIAGHAYGGITLYELMESCGYETEKINDAISEDKSEILNKRTNMDANERLKACVNDFKTGIETFTTTPYINKNLYSFIDTVDTLYGVEDVSISIEDVYSDIKEFNHEKFPNAENAKLVRISYTEKDYSAEFGFILFYSETKKGMVIVFGAAFDAETILECDSSFANEIFMTGTNKELSTIKNREYLSIFRWKNRKQKRRNVISFTESAEERLLRCIFGNENQKKRPYSVEGTGFYIDRVPDYLVIEFIEKHKKVFCQSDDEKKYYKEVVESKSSDPKKYFTDAEYKGDSRNACSTGWGNVIANIIYRETDIDVEYFADDDHDYENRPCIMLTEKRPWQYNETERNLSLESFNQILDVYARELRCEVSNCYWLMMMEC